MKDFAEFLAWETSTRDTIDFKKCYVDLAGGDLVAGILLSQMVWYHLPNSRTNKTKLRVKKKGHLWLAKERADWYSEIRITPRQYDRASNILVDLGIIEKRNFLFGGAKVSHTRIIQERFLELMSRHAGNAYDAGVRAEEAFVEEHESIMGMAEDAGSAWADAPEPVAMPALEGNPDSGTPGVAESATPLQRDKDLVSLLDKSNKETLSPGEGKDDTKVCVRCGKNKPVSQTIDQHERCAVCLFTDAWDHYIGKRGPRHSSNDDNVRSYVGSVTKIKSKMNTRLKDSEFRKGWIFALERASHQDYLMAKAWFNPEYFLRDDGNWQKIVNGVFDSFEKDYPASDLERFLARKRAGLAS